VTTKEPFAFALCDLDHNITWHEFFVWWLQALEYSTL